MAWRDLGRHHSAEPLLQQQRLAARVNTNTCRDDARLPVLQYRAGNTDKPRVAR
ncbi:MULTISPECIES: hypothetical protein [unclassified Bradyrhizobium]|uniref:hypothetical protein n=1 Tax=unclassified Bradyrhizobium TaxID=2631580 RepID=UPI001FF9744F|nr:MULTISPECIES: hypothetical protein [unclassified Bradyrhizobium]MCK1708425.1 hypothetical protein [Bradyrhizobium sp. 143]MCK1731012.1 hypothetical protein [Bradyrhizobium sp. 142]